MQKATWSEDQVLTVLYAFKCAAYHYVTCDAAHTVKDTAVDHRNCLIYDATSKPLLLLIGDDFNVEQQSSAKYKHDSPHEQRRPKPNTDNSVVIDLAYQIFCRQTKSVVSAAEHSLTAVRDMWSSFVKRYQAAKRSDSIGKLQRRQQHVVDQFEHHSLHQLFDNLMTEQSPYSSITSSSITQFGDNNMATINATDAPLSRGDKKRRSDTPIERLMLVAERAVHPRDEFEYDDYSADEDTMSYDVSAPQSPSSVIMSAPSRAKKQFLGVSSQEIGTSSNQVTPQMIDSLVECLGTLANQLEHGLDELEHLVGTDLKNVGRASLLQQNRISLCMDRIDSLQLACSRHASQVDQMKSSMLRIHDELAVAESKLEAANSSFVPRSEYESLVSKYDTMAAEVAKLKMDMRDAVLASTAWPSTDPFLFDSPNSGVSSSTSNGNIHIDEDHIRRLIAETNAAHDRVIYEHVAQTQEQMRQKLIDLVMANLPPEAQVPLGGNSNLMIGSPVKKSSGEALTTALQSLSHHQQQPQRLDLHGFYALHRDVGLLRSETKQVNDMLEQLLRGQLHLTKGASKS